MSIEGWKSIGEILEEMDFSSYNPLDKYEDSLSYFDKLKILRNYYLKNEQDIIEWAKINPTVFRNPYPIDWSRLFTPIEAEAWSSIRTKGQTALYPQYPVANYHLDFGNPYFKIGLELDGAKYHDSDRDFNRDIQLKQCGWTIFRISGKEMNNFSYYDEIDDPDLDEYDLEAVSDIKKRWLLTSGDGVIEAIRQIYFLKNRGNGDYWSSVFFDNCAKTLQTHKLV